MHVGRVTPDGNAVTKPPNIDCVPVMLIAAAETWPTGPYDRELECAATPRRHDEHAARIEEPCRIRPGRRAHRSTAGLRSGEVAGDVDDELSATLAEDVERGDARQQHDRLTGTGLAWRVDVEVARVRD